jgi:hypothetical protein
MCPSNCRCHPLLISSTSFTISVCIASYAASLSFLCSLASALDALSLSRAFFVAVLNASSWLGSLISSYLSSFLISDCWKRDEHSLKRAMDCLQESSEGLRVWRRVILKDSLYLASVVLGVWSFNEVSIVSPIELSFETSSSNSLYALVYILISF